MTQALISLFCARVLNKGAELSQLRLIRDKCCAALA